MAFIFFGLTQCYKKLYSAQPENDDIGNNFTGFINVTMIDSGASKSQSCCGDTTAIQAFAQSKSQLRGDCFISENEYVAYCQWGFFLFYGLNI